MKHDPHSYDEFLPTKQGAKLFRISQEDYQQESRHALSATRLLPHQIYRSNATSLQLEVDHSAVTFNVLLVEKIAQPNKSIGSTGLLLAVLDDDFRALSHHIAELDRENRWRIRPPNNPIMAVKGLRTALMDKIKLGYLLEEDDTTFQEMVETPRFEDATTFYQLYDKFDKQNDI